MATQEKVAALKRRHRRVRKKISGTPDRPRLAVFRSNRQAYAQLIDDVTGTTLAAASTLTDGGKGSPKERAAAAGKALAARATKAGITKVTFDRGGFQYHGQVRAIAEAAREGGLEL